MSGPQIHVFKFYTAENPPHYVFKAHVGIVQCVAWLEDDSGFVSTGWDSAMYLWRLELAKPRLEEPADAGKSLDDARRPRQTNPVWEHKFKNLQVQAVVPYREEATSPLTLYMTVKDKSLREFAGSAGPGYDLKEKCRLEQMVQTGPVALMHRRKAIFMGTTD